MTTWFMLLLGALLGWATHPVIWLVAGPFRWLALMYGVAQQESGMNPDATNPERLLSLGLCQFQTDTWNLVAPARWATATSAGLQDDPRRSPIKVGYVSAGYVQAAIIEDLRWLLIALPVIGFGALRLLWVGGIGSIEYRGLDEARAIISTEGRGFPAFVKARAVSLAVLIPLIRGWAMSRRKVRDAL